MAVTVDEEFRAIQRPLSDPEYEALTQDILKHGCRDAIVVWNGLIIDGYHRYQICTEHGIRFRTKGLNFKDRDEVRQWIVNNQLGRRNLNVYQRATLALKLEPFIRAEAKERQREAGRKHGRGQKKKVHTEKNKPIETMKIIGEKVGLSKSTVYKAKIIHKYGDEKMLKKLEQGETTITRCASALFGKYGNKIHDVMDDYLVGFSERELVKRDRHALIQKIESIKKHLRDAHNGLYFLKDNEEFNQLMKAAKDDPEVRELKKQVWSEWQGIRIAFGTLKFHIGDGAPLDLYIDYEKYPAKS